MELIYKGETLEKETKTTGLTEEQTFYVKDYGTGWYKVKVTAENRKIKNSMGKSNKRIRRSNTTNNNNRTKYTKWNRKMV